MQHLASTLPCQRLSDQSVQPGKINRLVKDLASSRCTSFFVQSVAGVGSREHPGLRSVQAWHLAIKQHHHILPVVRFAWLMGDTRLARAGLLAVRVMSLSHWLPKPTGAHAASATANTRSSWGLSRQSSSVSARGESRPSPGPGVSIRSGAGRFRTQVGCPPAWKNLTDSAKVAGCRTKQSALPIRVNGMRRLRATCGLRKSPSIAASHRSSSGAKVPRSHRFISSCAAFRRRPSRGTPFATPGTVL